MYLYFYIITKIVLSAAVLADAVSSLFLDDTGCERRTVTRRRKSVNSIFRELGSYYVRRSYRMREVDFWNILHLIVFDIKLFYRFDDVKIANHY